VLPPVKREYGLHFAQAGLTLMIFVLPQIQLTILASLHKSQGPNFMNRSSLIDVVAHDPKTDEVVLVMKETGTWDGSEARLCDLQERFNAYVSFLLDGELAETHPELTGKCARIEVRCEQVPDLRTLELLGLIHDQLAFQEIKMEVVVRGEHDPGTDDEKPA
jgi:hypothetical protein